MSPSWAPASYQPPPPLAAPLADAYALRDVALTTDSSPLGDLLAPWIAQYNEAAANATTLINNYALAPDVGLQQFLANQGDFWQQILSDPSSIPTVVNQMQENLHAVSSAYTLLDADSATMAATQLHTLDGGGGLATHTGILGILLNTFPPSDLPILTPIFDFLTSPLSGILIGELGPSLSPWVALLNSISAGDSFNETLANMVGAYFNGADLNLTSLIPLIESTNLLPLPAGTTISHLDLALGGLFTPGDVSNAPYELGHGAADIPAVGGSIFNSLGLGIKTGEGAIAIDIPSSPVGPIGAEEGWSQAIAGLLGAPAWNVNWSGKEHPTPPPPDPPLTGASLPTIPDDFFDDGGTGGTAAAEATNDLPAWLVQLAGDLGLSI